ncbi:unnamed protein product [Chilo suppressalis]|uniref:Uncharacterized protein n=1 Tax=Chilo suppressalis TaxID=168631 RepID=A0ABN8BAD7_CHISP|nr:unnamed protein product [Chilo suppressalis]
MNYDGDNNLLARSFIFFKRYISLCYIIIITAY